MTDEYEFIDVEEDISCYDDIEYSPEISVFERITDDGKREVLIYNGITRFTMQ